MRRIIIFIVFLSLKANASNATDAYCQDLVKLSDNKDFISQAEIWAASILGSQIDKKKFTRSQNSYRFISGFRPSFFAGTSLNRSNIFVLKSNGNLVTKFLIGPRAGVGLVFSSAPINDSVKEADRELYGKYLFYNINANLALSCVIW